MIRLRVTVFFVREDFIRAVAATDLPHDFTLDDLHWPLPGMVAGFPPQFMREYMGRDICYVYAANCDAGDYHVPGLAGCPTVTVPRSKVGWQWYSWRGGNLESFVTSFFRGDRVDEAITNYGYTDYTGIKDTEGIEADRMATDRVSALMLKLLVVLNTRPSLIEYGQCERPLRLKHGRVKQRELWSPNVIGWRYRPVEVSPASGTHASPRLHWRRGHVRNQPHGPGRAQRRLIWIEPQLIGVDRARVRSWINRRSDCDKQANTLKISPPDAVVVWMAPSHSDLNPTFRWRSCSAYPTGSPGPSGAAWQSSPAVDVARLDPLDRAGYDDPFAAQVIQVAAGDTTVGSGLLSKEGLPQASRKSDH